MPDLSIKNSVEKLMNEKQTIFANTLKMLGAKNKDNLFQLCFNGQMLFFNNDPQKQLIYAPSVDITKLIISSINAEI